MFAWIWVLGICDQVCVGGGERVDLSKYLTFLLRERTFWFLELTLLSG